MFINTVGTFGVSSASYFLLESGWREYRFAIMSFFILAAVLGIPLSWHKTLRGNAVVWVGFELVLESHKVGISQRLAEWFVRWATEMAVHMRAFEDGLCRIMFVAGALEHERPFFGPLYKFLTVHFRNAVRRAASRAIVTTIATSSWRSLEWRRESMHRQVRHAPVLADGFRMWERTEKSIAGSHPGSH